MSKLGSNKLCDSVIKIRSKEGETCKGIVMSVAMYGRGFMQGLN